MRIIIDTNVWVSFLLSPLSVPSQAVQRAARNDVILMSEPLFLELCTTLDKPKLRKRINAEKITRFLNEIPEITLPVSIIQQVQLCRDPKDDMLLELALNGEADMLITGDEDVLALHPFYKTAIVTPQDFIAL